jgi:hypothetical protein
MKHTLTAITLAILSATAGAQSFSNAQFVNGLAIPGGLTDLGGGSAFDSRVGFFSDIYFDPNRNEWWGLSDRGPGGGTLAYDTRIQRFTIDVNASTGAISNFQVAQTIKFSDNGAALNGLAPNPAGTLGNSFDPEGMVVNPLNGNLLVSDEYGPSLIEFDRSGNLVRRYTVPSNLVPQVGAAVNYNSAPPTQTSGREGNRGLEGLAISPDGRYAYAVLQNGTVQDGWTSASRSQYSRIVKFDTATGLAVGQYAYAMDTNPANGRVIEGGGISAIVALGNDKFLMLERNNRGVGVGATFANADKKVYEIDLSTATDVTNITLPGVGVAASGSFTAVTKGARVIDLDANTLTALGNKSPEKWEGLAIGPRLNNGQFLVLAGTDNDYSVTQNGSNVQFDVYFDFSASDPYAASIQCPVGMTTGCFTTATANTTQTPAAVTAAYALLPGVLHAYTADVIGYVSPVPEADGLAMAFAGLGVLGFVARRRRMRTA